MIDRPDQSHNHLPCVCGHPAYIHCIEAGQRGQCTHEKCRPRCRQFEEVGDG